MYDNTEFMIKGKVAEVIVEELFRELGFYVIKFGAEHTISPLQQLQGFVKARGGKFQFSKDENITPLKTIKSLPDFVIVSPSGEVEFVEVKFRKNGILSERDDLVLSTFPDTFIICVNYSISNDFFKIYSFDSEADKQEMIASRFHVHYKESPEDSSDEYEVSLATLTDFLDDSFKVKLDSSTKERYEKLVLDWLKR